MMADLIVDRGLSAVLDVSQFEHDTEKARFAGDFASRFFFRKKARPSAVHIFIEEAQEFCPEEPRRGEENMVHAFTRMWKLGRNFGIGGSLITQRPQEVSKKVLNLAECVFAFQLTGPHERKALEKWIAERGIDEDIGAILPKLTVGQVRVWSPAWLKISKTIQILPKSTFDASSTPGVGKRAAVRELAPIDLERLRVDMAATIEKAKAEDPRELQRQVRELKAKIAQMDKAAPVTKGGAPADAEQLKREFDRGANSVKGLLAKELRACSKTAAAIQPATLAALRDMAAAAARAITHVEQVQMPSMPSLEGVIEQAKATRSPAVLPVRTKVPVERTKMAAANGEASKIGNTGLRRMLIALAQRRNGISTKQLGVRAGISSKSGTFGTYLGRGRANGWIAGERGQLKITEAGVAALGNYEPLPEGRELLEYWLNELGDSGAGRMLSALAERYPQGFTAEELGKQADISSASGTFGTYLGRLRSLELISGSRSELKASDEFCLWLRGR